MMRVLLLVAILLVGVGGSAQAESASLDLSTKSAPPGATISVVGNGFGTFVSTQFNQVLFAGVPALIQRWEPDMIEVRVPFRAATGSVEVVIGEKTLQAGKFTVVTPEITGLTPNEAEPGTLLRITGQHFGMTSGARDPNTMFGVNDVLVGGIVVRPRRWKDERIEVEVPANAVGGEIVVRLASSDPLPDGSCCAPVEYLVSNAVSFSVIPSVRVDPISGPVGTKVDLFGEGFGSVQRTDDAVLFGGKPATIALWKDKVIVVHVPLDAESGPVVLHSQGRSRTVAQFTVHTPKVSSISPVRAPIGTLLRINGEHFGFYTESGSTPYSFTDFDRGKNRVEIGGVPAIVYRWNDDRIDVWVPFSAVSGKVMVYRGATKPTPDGRCCSEQKELAIEAGEFTLVHPVIESYEPKSAGLDATVVIRGKGFGTFLKTAEHAELGLNQKAYTRRTDLEINESGSEPTVVSNVSRTEVLFNGAAALVQSWSDTEIVVKVPRRNLYGIGKRGAFFDNLATGPLVVRRGSWDLLADGTCCTSKKWITLEAGPFTIETKGLPDTGYWDDNRPDANTNQ